MVQNTIVFSVEVKLVNIDPDKDLWVRWLIISYCTKSAQRIMHSFVSLKLNMTGHATRTPEPVLFLCKVIRIFIQNVLFLVYNRAKIYTH